MEIQHRFGSGLTVGQARELYAVAEEKLDLEPRPVEFDQRVAGQVQSGRGQDDVTRLGGIFPIDEDDHTQLALERDVPNQGRIQLHVVGFLQRAEGVETAEVLKVDLTVVLASRPAALGMRTGIKE